MDVHGEMGFEREQRDTVHLEIREREREGRI